MKKKLLGIFVCMLLIATALPAVGTMNIEKSDNTTNDNIDLSVPSSNIVTPLCNTGLFSLQDNVILWDNYCLTWKTGYHAQDDPPEEPEQWDSFVADDFMFEEETEVHWVFWQNIYGWAPPKDYHYDWNITFFEDDGTGNNPGVIYEGPITIADEAIEKSHSYINESFPNNMWGCGLTTFLPEPVTFDADTKYWITIYSIGPIYPQTYFPVHNESLGGILLHEAKFLSDHWGFPVWTNFSEVDEDGEPLDANFVLGGDPPFEVKIKKGLGVTITIANNLPEGFVGIIHNMTVNITATGGFVLNPIKNVLIPEFEGQTTETIKWYPLGFGIVTIDVVCTSAEIGIGSTDTTGFLILVFLF